MIKNTANYSYHCNVMYLSFSGPNGVSTKCLGCRHQKCMDARNGLCHSGVYYFYKENLVQFELQLDQRFFVITDQRITNTQLRGI